MVTINPADCGRHELYEGTFEDERWTMRRAFPEDEHYRWHMSTVRPGLKGIYSRKAGDDEVSDLVRLVPDLGDELDALLERNAVLARERDQASELLAHAVVDREDARRTLCAASARVSEEQARAEKAESQRDRAEASRDRLRFARDLLDGELRLAREERQKAERDRDEARERYDRLRGEYEKQAEAWGEKRDAYEARLKCQQQLMEAHGVPRDTVIAPPAPTVTRAEVEKAITGVRGWIHPVTTAEVADAVCALLGIAYPTLSPVQVRAREYAAAVGIDWGHAEPEDVDLLMKVAAHVIGGETDE